MHSSLSLLRLALIYLAVASCHVLTALAQQPETSRPIPDPDEIKQRVIANEKKSAQQKERYLCLVKEETDELGQGGEVKHRETKESEQFYLNGQEIDHLLKKNGIALSDAAARKEQGRVTKEVKNFSDPKQVKKIQDEEQKQVDLFLKALRYSNGHRESRNSRSTIIYDLSGDPAFHATDLEQRFAKALVGRIWIDEATGELLELRVTTDRDVKVAGGLLASLHKGFQLHLEQARQADGVWLASLVEGSGDARAGLFFHPRFRFRQIMGHCRLYSVDATGNSGAPSTPN